MVILRTLLFAYLATACYSPELADCTVTCSQAADCAPGQVCGADGFCAIEEVAGRCVASGPDAGVGDAMIDAPVVTLSVRIDGHGVVSIPNVGDCGQPECAFDVEQATPITLSATPKNQWRFARWSEACAGQATSTCAIAPAMNASVHVQFEKVDDLF